MIHRRSGFRKKKVVISLPIIIIIVFVLSMIIFNVQMFMDLIPSRSYYTESGNTELPVIYQDYNGKKVNELHAYVDENYKMVANETLSLLDNDRKFNIVIQKNDSVFSQIEYEIRDKSSNELIERTQVAVPIGNQKEIPVTLNIQNLISEGTTYSLQIKIDLIDRRAYYFTNILYKRSKNNLNDVLTFISEFSEYSFSKTNMAEKVIYLETSVNRDLRQLYKVNIESSFEQITWADTEMELLSDLSYKVYIAQDYCYNIDINYLSRAKNEEGDFEYYISTDKYVVRWDERRFYIMKFDRNTEELLNLDNEPFDKNKNRLYLGVTNPEKLQKKESPSGKFVALCKQNEIYLYDDEEKELKTIYANRLRSKEEYDKLSKDFEVKLYDVDDTGQIKFIIYGYNMKGNNEGLLGISIYTYNHEENELDENCFLPIYTTFQNLKYDLEKLSTFIGDTFYFKSYDKIYSANINTEETIMLLSSIDETRSSTGLNGTNIAYNTTNDNDNNIHILNITTMTEQIITPENSEIIEVIGCMNEDLFYGITTAENLWIEDKKIIGRPFQKINAINMNDGTKRVFEEEGIYYYNFVTSDDTLRYNKYRKEENHFNIITNGVILNNLKEEVEELFPIKEEYTTRKLRVAYLEIDCYERTFSYDQLATINLKDNLKSPIEQEPPKESDIFYVYTNGELVSKRKNLSDGITEIRDSYGYVKLNDQTTCYNRSNKANALYIRTNDSILENLNYFEEDFCLINYQTLVMNITGVTERDLEYYISLSEKVAVFKNDHFQYFVTGFDNNNYVLEYIDGERRRILTPRAEVHNMITNEGYIVFAQLEKLE